MSVRYETRIELRGDKRQIVVRAKNRAGARRVYVSIADGNEDAKRLVSEMIGKAKADLEIPRLPLPSGT